MGGKNAGFPAGSIIVVRGQKGHQFPIVAMDQLGNGIQQHGGPAVIGVGLPLRQALGSRNTAAGKGYPGLAHLFGQSGLLRCAGHIGKNIGDLRSMVRVSIGKKISVDWRAVLCRLVGHDFEKGQADHCAVHLLCGQSLFIGIGRSNSSI